VKVYDWGQVIWDRRIKMKEKEKTKLEGPILAFA
jgi:hypothetical protein